MGLSGGRVGQTAALAQGVALGDAEAALNAARAQGFATTLRSVPGAARYAGLAFLKALFESLKSRHPTHHNLLHLKV